MYPDFRTVAQFGLLDPMVDGSSLFGLATQSADNKALTTARNKSDSVENRDLVSGLFSALENCADLRAVIEWWPELSVELRQAIVKMVQ